MKAILEGRVVAESDDIVECDGYQYFPSAGVRTEWLEKTEKTESRSALPAWRPVLRRGDRRRASRARRLVL